MLNSGRPSPRWLSSPLVWLPLLWLAAFLAGQEGIPVEDGGEIEAVAALGGVNHPPGMPLLSLLARFSWLVWPGGGLRLLFAAMAALALLLLTRGSLPTRLLALLVVLMPAAQERVLAWDAYGPLFLLLALSMVPGLVREGPRRSALGGYLAGLALCVHPQGLIVAVVVLMAWVSWNRSGLALTIGCLALGLSTYLLLPLSSAAGAVVDWGSSSSCASFVRQVTAAGYREVYTAIGGFSAEPLLLHIGALWRLIWPALLVPLLALPAGAVPGLGERLRGRPGGRTPLEPLTGRLPLCLAVIVALDLLFVVVINPMAAGTSQTGTASLLVLLLLAFEGVRRLEGRAACLVLLAVVLTLMPPRRGLTDQRETVESVLSRCPRRTALALSDNDLLYGCWSACYARDSRPDVVLLSPENFSGWFEDMVSHFHPDFDLSTSVMDVGGRDLPREVLSGRLIEAAIDSNPGYTFLFDR